MLKNVNPLYKEVELDLSDECKQRLQGFSAELVDRAVCTDDFASAVNLVSSNVAHQAWTAENVGSHDVVLGKDAMEDVPFVTPVLQFVKKKERKKTPHEKIKQSERFFFLQREEHAPVLHSQFVSFQENSPIQRNIQ